MGVCFRLYTEEAFNNMEASSEPEILRCSLASSILQLKCLGEDLEDLDLMDKPDTDASKPRRLTTPSIILIVLVISAYKTLWLLEAINENKAITPLGKQMASFPLEPMHARSLLASKEYGCTSEILDIISILSASSKLFLDITEQRDAATEARLKFRHSSGDHMTILNAVRAYQDIAASESKGARKDWCRKHYLNERTLLEAKEIREQLCQACSRVGIDWTISCRTDEQPVLKCIAHGLVQNSALIQSDGSYKQTMAQSVRRSVVAPTNKYLSYAHLAGEDTSQFHPL